MAHLAVDVLRAAGVSRPKVSYLRDLASRVVNGRLDLESLRDHTDEELVKGITTVKGPGRWGADVFLIFRLGRPDILPARDISFAGPLKELINSPTSRMRRLLKTAEPWRQGQTLACMCLHQFPEAEKAEA